jgi:hypothetical protein
MSLELAAEDSGEGCESGWEEEDGTAGWRGGMLYGSDYIMSDDIVSQHVRLHDDGNRSGCKC